MMVWLCRENVGAVTVLVGFTGDNQIITHYTSADFVKQSLKMSSCNVGGSTTANYLCYRQPKHRTFLTFLEKG
jgi:hypothetical protein